MALFGMTTRESPLRREGSAERRAAARAQQEQMRAMAMQRRQQAMQQRQAMMQQQTGAAITGAEAGALGSRAPQYSRPPVMSAPGNQQAMPGGQSFSGSVVQPGQPVAPRGGGQMVQPGQAAPYGGGNARMVSPGNSGNTPAATGQLPPQAAPQAQQAFGNRPQRPAGVGRPTTDPQTRAQINALRGGRPEGAGPKQLGESGQAWGAQRAAQRRNQYAQGPQPSAQDLWRYNNKGAASVKDKLGGQDFVASPWMSNEGVILQDGTRMSAKDLSAAGYKWQAPRAERYMSGSNEGSPDNFDRIIERRPGGWKKTPKAAEPWKARMSLKERRQAARGNGIANRVKTQKKKPYVPDWYIGPGEGA